MASQIALKNSGGFTGTLQFPDTIASDQVYNLADIIKRIDMNYGSKVVVEKFSNPGHNTLLALADNGKLYSTSGHNGASWAWATGRGANGYAAPYGLMGWKIVPIPDTSPVVDCGLYGHNGFALLQNGNLYTWGLNSDGCLGVGDTLFRPTPVLSTTNVTDVYCDGTKTGYNAEDPFLHIRKTDGYLYGVGNNAHGQLGDGTNVSKSSWTKITSLGTDISKVWSMGCSHGITIVQKNDKSIWMTGYNGYGQIGNGTTTTLTSFTNVTSFWGTGLEILKVGGTKGENSNANSHTIMLLVNTSGVKYVKTSGRNHAGQLGDGTTGDKSSPVTILSGTNIVDISTQHNSAIALFSDNTIRSWGYNAHGQLGLGNTTNTLSPTVVNVSGVTEIFNHQFTTHSNGWVNQYFIKKSDGIYATGNNVGGYCATGDTGATTTFKKTLLPATIRDISFLTTSNEGRSYYAVSNNNYLYTWGYDGNDGVTGDSGNSRTYIPTPIQFTIEENESLA